MTTDDDPTPGMSTDSRADRVAEFLWAELRPGKDWSAVPQERRNKWVRLARNAFYVSRGYPHPVVTGNQVFLLQQLATDKPMADVAKCMGVTHKSAYNAAIRVYRKMGVTSRHGAVATALRAGIIE